MIVRFLSGLAIGEVLRRSRCEYNHSVQVQDNDRLASEDDDDHRCHHHVDTTV